ncbi:MAG TPA: pantetheine-phosphate adenylyltransferase [Crocinitomicaceae bacterium]|nr:pantetheine-phosphate adenylyltransferase [Flavobacteriales bacterium]HBW87251.1 pantetheine-phosphate adenylyltransferase [Crocinitomicaceae bacterium]
MKRIGLFPGSFDPFTKGHEAVVRKSLSLFDQLIIGIGVNSRKEYLFTLENRKKHIQSLFSDEEKVTIAVYQELTVTFCKKIGATHIVRGLRDSKDFQYEKSIAHMNFQLAEFETVFLLTNQEFSAVNSSIIREMHLNGADISSFVTSPQLLV